LGFLITMAKIWLAGATESAAGWRVAFMILAAGPAMGVSAMIVLQRRLTYRNE
jgi:hypothetical protein